MPLKCHINTLCPNYLMFINGGNIPIFKSHINSLASTMQPGVLYTDDDDNSDNDTAWLHRLSWLFGQII